MTSHGLEQCTFAKGNSKLKGELALYYNLCSLFTKLNTFVPISNNTYMYLNLTLQKQPFHLSVQQ